MPMSPNPRFKKTNRLFAYCPRSIFYSVGTTALLLLLTALFVLPGTREFGAKDDEDIKLNSVLGKMESAGENFRDFTADFAWKKYTAVLEEFDTPEKGMFYYSRARDGTALIRQEVTSPGKRILTIKDGVVTIYQPKIKQAKIAHLGEDKDKVEYMALGIGQSPSNLKRTFDISYLGTETLNGEPCAMLALEPKSAERAALYESTTIWINEQNGIPVQHKFLEPSGDYLLSSFFDVKLNSGVSNSKFVQKLPKGVEIIRIQ